MRIKHKENIFKESKDLNLALIDKDISTEMNAGILRFHHIMMAFRNNLFYRREKMINVESKGRLTWYP